MEKKEKAPSLEENFENLRQIIDKLEGKDLSLDDAFDLYAQGVALSKSCEKQIDRVEKKVLKLTEKGALEEYE